MDLMNSQAAGSYAILIDFSWGENGAHTRHYTNWSDPITIGGVTYAVQTSSGPNIETRISVEAENQTGLVQDEPWSLLMPAVEPLNFLARPSVWPPVTCVVSEVDPTSTGVLAPTVMWAGTVTTVTSNLKEAPGSVRAVISGKRVRVQYPLGIESKSACSRTFGDRGCGVDVGALEQTATITGIAGRIISAPGLTTPGRADYWSAGIVSVDGLRVGIIDGSLGVGSLKLLQVPPVEWIGVAAVFRPGCNKGITQCTSDWNNAPRFFGLGRQKPSGAPYIGPR